jgi:hypothetical protein
MMNWKDKEQIRIYQVEYRRSHIEDLRKKKHAYYMAHREERIAYVANHHRLHPEVNKRAVRKYQKSHRREVSERNKNFRKRNPEKARAGWLAQKKIPLAEKCELCGRKAEDRHHPDYSKPLEVMHLCKKCHRKEDRKRKIA